MKLDHGAIGNGRVIALVGPDTSIDWLCLPRFDSPSIFARLLDEERGGSFAFEPMDLISSSMAYVRNTNVLRTEVITTQGRYEVVDFAPRLPTGLSVDAPPEIHRLVRPLEGTPRIRVRFDPRPDYARATPGDHPAKARASRSAAEACAPTCAPTCRRPISNAATSSASIGRCSSC